MLNEKAELKTSFRSSLPCEVSPNSISTTPSIVKIIDLFWIGYACLFFLKFSHAFIFDVLVGLICISICEYFHFLPEASSKILQTFVKLKRLQKSNFFVVKTIHLLGIDFLWDINPESIYVHTTWNYTLHCSTNLVEFCLIFLARVLNDFYMYAYMSLMYSILCPEFLFVSSSRIVF